MSVRLEFIEFCVHSICESLHSRIRGGLRRACFGLALVALISIPAWPQQKSKNLSDKSLEDLMNIEVTSVSKKEQKLSRIASAIFAITQDDIRHSGATNIPDLLRMVPGLNVAQINGSTWAISSRGLNSQFANKLLVLIDGRTVYTPLFAGVYWDVQDVPLEDIDRIEVIRGSGATVWGANAVNGVINIITKNAKETQGGLLTAGGGTHEQGFGVAQYGGQLNHAASFRFFVKGFDQNSLPSLSGQDGRDGYDLYHGGFRVDSTLSKQNSLTVQGDIYGGSKGEIVNIVALTPPFTSLVAAWAAFSGGNVLGRWNHTLSPHSGTSLQVYFDRTERNGILDGETVNTFDIDFQHHAGWGNRQDLVWGVGYRYISYGTRGTLGAMFNPPSANRQLFSSFVQDEITLTPDHLYLTLGAKFEHNEFSGFEFQPSARLAWNVAKDHMLWAGYSKAQRTPAPLDRGLRSGFAAFPGPGGIPILLTALGNPNTVSENLHAFEAGYRTQLLANISMDLSAFYNRYGKLQTFEPVTPFLELNPPPVHLNVPIIYANLMHGETHGMELAVNWKMAARWTLSPGYTFERIHLHTDPSSQDTESVSSGEGASSHHQAQLRSNLAWPGGFEWNASLYFVGRLPAQQVPAYTRLDTGMTWRAFEHLAISLIGQNLLKNDHLESSSPNQGEISSRIKRSAYAKFTWQF